MSSDFQQTVVDRGQEIFNSLGGSGKSVFNKDWWYGKIMDWSMQNPDFKTQMFRFVDVLPMLDGGKEVSRHLKEYFAESDGKLPSIFNFGLGMGSLAPNLMAGTIKKNVTQMAKLFIAGQTASEALVKLKDARQRKMAFTLDILGEACLSEVEALEYHRQYLTLIDDLVRETQQWPQQELVDQDDRGAIPTVNVSVKLTAIYSQIHPEAWQHSKDNLKQRLRPILDKAVKNFVFINIDMEKYAVKDLTLEVFEELLMEDAYRDYRHFGIVVQAYLRDSYKDIERLVAFSQQRGTPFSVRLVKGAYWDYETIGALQKNWANPVYTNKQESDANYEQCTRLLLENAKTLSAAIASHNVRSVAHAIAVADELGLPKNAFEVQMLYGMAEPIKQSLIKKGYRMREYCPMGDLLPGMSYLVRRLLENTSNQSFLKSKFADGESEMTLLADPQLDLQASADRPAPTADRFVNEPLQNFSFAEPRRKMGQALAAFKNDFLQKAWSSKIDGGEDHLSTSTLPIINPSNESEIGTLHLATPEQADAAVTGAKAAFAQWSRQPASTRADVIDKVADILSRDKFRLMACEVFEAGKNWHEADGDVCEAIDFCRYYAADMRRLSQKRRVGSAPGETSMYEYIPRGVNTVIAPWNFPLAILTGMVSASLVTGNTVVMKPAEQTPMVAQFLWEAFAEAGLPSGALQLVQGEGESVGERLVTHKDVVMVCFTGSQHVGLQILQKASVVQPGQTHIKRCLTELGGKNAIIVDSDADLDEAVAGVLHSAFGFQGQKCSACSRVVIIDSLHDRFVDRLVEAAKSLEIGDAANPASAMGPVIDREAFARIQKTVAEAKETSSLRFQGEAPSQGYFVPPTIFTDVAARDPLAQQEIFGPVLAIVKAKNIDEAIEITNDTPYALTAAIFSRSPAHIEKAKSEVMVGNFYVNRGSTGAVVERHPFGGFRLSGGGSKTGGPDYLAQFMDPKVVTENTLRRGFSPDLMN